MRALRLRDFGEMVIDTLPDPVPGPGEVLLRIVATGICGSDIHGFTGHNGRRFPGQVMGHEAVGTVAALGDGVDGEDFTIGTPATFNPVVLSDDDARDFAGFEQRAPNRFVIGVAKGLAAAFAQKLVVPARNVVPLPTTMPIAHGALIEPLAVALHACRRINITSDDTVLIIGGGPIGQSAVLAAKHEGATKIYVSEPDSGRRDLCRELGAIVLDPATRAPAEQIAALEGELVDKVIDAVGISPTIDAALSAVKFGGMICLLGMGDPNLEVPAYRISTEERSVIGSFCYSYATFREAAAWVGANVDNFETLISEEVPLSAGPDAFTRLASGTDVAGKILVRLDREV